IAQSKALSPAADEPASLLRDDRNGEAFPTVPSLDAGQDKENIAKTSAMPHESSPRVPSLDADEGSIQQRLHELMKQCTSLQRQQSQLAAKIKDQDLEISGLKARVKSLEVKESRREEPFLKDAPITGRIMDIGEELGANKSTERGSTDTKEMVAREMEEEFARENQRLSEQVTRDYEIARIHAEEELKLMIEGLDRSNEVIAKHLSEYEQAEADLSIGEKIELIIWKQWEDFVPMSSKEKSKRVKRPGLKLDQGSSKRVKISHTSGSESSQEQQFKGSKGVYEEELKGMMQIVSLEEVYIEALQMKHPIIDCEIHSEGKREYWNIIRLGGHTETYQFFVDMLKHFDIEDLHQLWILVKETFSIKQFTSNKEKEFWVKLKRLFEPDSEDQL
nr:hypothetical protein [Tanacetum cinerariifolium]